MAHVGRSLTPGDDLINEDPRVIAIAEVTWTPEVIQSHQDSLEQQINTPEG